MLLKHSAVSDMCHDSPLFPVLYCLWCFNDKSNFPPWYQRSLSYRWIFILLHCSLHYSEGFPPKRNPYRARSEAKTSVYISSNMLSRQSGPPEAVHMIAPGEIRLTVSFPLCLLWEILLPNIWQECHAENLRHSGEAASPGIWPLSASEQLQVLSISSDCSTCQSAYSKVSPFPRKSSFSLPLGPVSKCHFSLDFTASLQPCTKAPVEGFLSAVVDLLSN